ncbi:MAG: GNAT family N-acetyltransferase [Culicoidibacterales bacterium]
MNLTYTTFYGETPDYFTDALSVRDTVFHLEQGYAREIDHDYMDKISWHVVCYDGKNPIGTARLYENRTENGFGIGRVAVEQNYRNKSIGLDLMQFLLSKATVIGKYRQIILHAQVHAQSFYEKLNFVAEGEVFLEDGQPHITMKMTLKLRGFEVAKGFETENILLPVRKTRQSAGYDLALSEGLVIPARTTKLGKTGLKAYMQEDEVLELHIRSSVAIKQNVWCANNVGIVDADYYSNPDNDGHIMVPLYNANDTEVILEKGDRVAQGIFNKYLTIDGEELSSIETRVGGFGSTGKTD